MPARSGNPIVTLDARSNVVQPVLNVAYNQWLDQIKRLLEWVGLMLAVLLPLVLLCTASLMLGNVQQRHTDECGGGYEK